MDFGADHVAGALPEVLAAVATALGPEAGPAASYGGDAWTAKAVDAVRDVFEQPDAEVLLLVNGTATNALALACLTPPYGSTYCSRNAHIATSECGAPEFFSGGAKLELVDADADGKLVLDTLESRLASRAANPKAPHQNVPSAVSVTQPTEDGGVYSVAEIEAIAGLAHKHNMLVHMDGARFANALQAESQATPAEMTWKAGVDVLSLGTTKNGTLCCEAIVFFTSAQSRLAEARFRCKRAGHFLEKQRFLAAQMLAYLKDDLWLRSARNANDRASDLARGIAATPGCSLVRQPAINILFVEMDKAVIAALRDRGIQLSLTAGSEESRGTPEDPERRARFRMCTQWSTTSSHIDDFLCILREVCSANAAAPTQLHA
ncbi:Low specificity L-threonine aldolase [Hondaea fermentalgiana]|uniref:Low specificity L-threonine aldolase n=1 Tax=Hondaea fermentalgiana TaxID=2315210 RepID=A0A2R5GLD9_9STRA|nr:Low specificity L-threonine aldolase [Hondaea fermentalgiana]|eukprot:GBG30558.1 Low specificity L-threonine aldolase [Hondaea fermentalgiana]